MTKGERGASRSGTGTVLEGVGGRYRILLADGTEREAVLRGRLRLERRTGDRVVCGDRVHLSGAEEPFAIEEVLPRENELVRAGPGGRGARIVAANLDRAVVVLAASEPPWDPALADRFLALVESAGVTPVLVVNKVDLPGGPEAAGEVASHLGGIGYRVLPVSARTGVGIPELAALLSDGISVVIGPSGVGKSSLLNAIEPGLALRTQEVRARSGQGRHTTVSARLLPLASGGWVADTPGFSDVRLWGIQPEALGRAFPEISEASEGCRFRGCSHLHEPDCAVRAAVEAGAIAASRFESYRELYASGE